MTKISIGNLLNTPNYSAHKELIMEREKVALVVVPVGAYDIEEDECSNLMYIRGKNCYGSLKYVAPK